jgi:hypothetical protein
MKKYFPIIILITISIIFFWKTIFKGYIPFPGDMLVGAYYPWLDQKWGNLTTSVPIKNPLITDVFSQFYLWKSIISDSFSNFKLPLWNIYSYAGYPLLANFHSAVFNPFNVLMVLFGKINGWTLMIFFQFLLSTISMYFFLKNLHNKKIGAIAGAITYGFSGFVISWSQFVTAGFAFIYLPLIFLSIFLSFKKNNNKYLLYLPILYFLTMTSGHFQALIYSCIFSGIYFLYNFFSQKNKNFKILTTYTLMVIISIGLMAIQLIPTLELSKYSIRFNEDYIKHYNYGLLPLNKLITLIAPDYFGNPVTFNYWGTFNYHETIVYSGVIAIFALIYSFLKRKNHFFLFSAIICLLLCFDTTIGKLLYTLKTPGLSTSAAGRIIFLYTFNIAVLVSFFINNINKEKFLNILKYYFIPLVVFAISVAVTFSLRNNENYKIAFRNLVLPSGLIFFIFATIVLIKNKTIQTILLISIITLDLFRFGWKYLPFVKREYTFPKNEITTFLSNQPGLFRIEKERGALLTPNTWTAFNLSSTSGYDPMALKDYSLYYQENFNNSLNNTSRYAELDNYWAKPLGNANVKYLLALKYNDIAEVKKDGKHLNDNIDKKDWTKIYEKDSVIIYENKYFKERIEIINDQDGIIENINYSPEEITLIAKTKTNSAELIIRDNWYPGWIATINDKNKDIEIYDKVLEKLN